MSVPPAGPGRGVGARLAEDGVLNPRALGRLLVLLAGLWPLAAGAVELSEQRDDRSGAPFWQWQGDGLSLRVMARPPDQARAFFIGRGFPDAAARRYARSCVLALTLRNRSAQGAVHHNLSRWRVRLPDGYRPLPGEQRWQRRWKRMGVPDRARTAFAWATFPEAESMGPGGYIMGMVATGLEPGRRFDLVVRWRAQDRWRQVVLEGLRCARARTNEEG